MRAAPARGEGARRPERADRASQFTLEEMELLGLFANQAAIVLDLLERARRAHAVPAETGDQAEALARVRHCSRVTRERGRDLLSALERSPKPS